jgi:hypothetical protein
MASNFTSSLKRALDLPVWEWLRFNPIGNTTTGWCTCTSELDINRYIYFLGTTFYRYDTWTDGWQQLATPPVALLTVGSMRYAAYNGHRCRAISSTANTITMPSLNGDVLIGKEIRIMDGTGMGQSNTITDVSDPIIYDQGILTTATAIQLTDATKKWTFNQWAGYQVRLTHAAGAGQIRVILYNDATNLYLSDPNYQAYDSWNNTGFSATAPYAIPVSTAGAQTNYVIEASTVTVQNNWTVKPDQSSRLMTATGIIWFISSAAAAPFFTFQCYDVARDAWFTKTATATLLASALATDTSLEKFVESAGIFDSGSVGGITSFAPSASLIDNTKSWPIDRYVSYQVRLTNGLGMGQKRRIIAMSGSYLQTDKRWDIIPDTSSVYAIYGNTDKIIASIGANGCLLEYNTEADLWSQGYVTYNGIARNMSAKWNGYSSYEAIGLAGIVRNTGGITSLATAAGGSGYFIGDVFNVVSASAALGKGRVTNVGYSGSFSSSVLGVELYAAGGGYAPAVGLTTSNILGAGVGLTVSIINTGSVGKVTSSMNHWFEKGDYVKIEGTTDPLWNTSSQILACDNLTTFDIATTALSNATATSVQGANTLVDTAMSWSNNELVGKIIQKSLVGVAGTSEAKRIISNISNSITVVSNWAANPVTGTGRYCIYDPQSFGRDEQYRNPTLNGRGYASNGTSSMLYDSTKNWGFNQWTGSKVRIIAGTGINNELTVFYNTPNTMSFNATQSFSPDSSSKYLIMDTFGLVTSGSATTITDTTKNWTINQWSGKRFRYLSGTGISTEAIIASNTSNTLTWAGPTLASTDTNYVIYGSTPKSTSHCLQWTWGNSNQATKGKYLWCPIGGGSTRFDRYDITTGLWDYGIYINPITEVLNTGTMYAYDGADRIYFTVNSTGRVFYLDVNTNKVYPYGVTPFAQGAAAIGNRMEVFTSPDGLNFIVILRHSGQEVWRSLIYV